jgi:hypothetical protein
MSMKNSSDTIGNRTCDLPTCSAVPRPTALWRIISDKFCASHVVFYFWKDNKLIIIIIPKTFTVVVSSNIGTRTRFDRMAIYAQVSHRNPSFTIIVCHCWIIVLCYLN